MSKNNRWQLQDAKNQFSRLVDEAQQQGPQVVTRRGADAVVVIAANDYRKLTRRRAQNLVSVLLDAPKVRGGLTAPRSADTGRALELE
jgi:prevent-host-death family protein